MFNILHYLFCLQTNVLRLNNLKTEQVTSAKFSEFVLYVEAIIYLLLYNLHGFTFKEINFRGFHGILANPRKLIHSNYFTEVLFGAASVFENIIAF